jgi:hypothetical protein
MRVSSLALLLCSWCVGGALFFVTLDGFSRGDLEGYAVLSLDEGVPDRAAAGALERGLGRPVISESSQWVFLNNFGSLERVSLEDYGDRLEVFDPRRDGYAQKLRDSFVRDGRRRFFIPLDRGLFSFPLPLNPRRALEARLAAILGAVPPPEEVLPGGGLHAGPAGPGPVLAEMAGQTGPGRAGTGGPVGPETAGPAFSLEMRRRGRPLGLRMVLLAAAWAAALIPGGRFPRPLSRRGEGPGRPPLLLLFPLTLPLGLWGGPGLALLAVVFLLGSLLREPLRELWVRAGGPPAGPRPPSLLGAGTYRFRLGYGLVAGPLLFVIPWLGGIPAFSAVLSLVGLGGLYCLGLEAETRRRSPWLPASGNRRPVTAAPAAPAAPLAPGSPVTTSPTAPGSPAAAASAAPGSPAAIASAAVAFPAASGPEGGGGSSPGPRGGPPGRGAAGPSRRFVPLPILSSRGFAGSLVLPLPVLSFALASCLAVAADLLVPLMPGGPGSRGDSGLGGSARPAAGSRSPRPAPQAGEGTAGLGGTAASPGRDGSGDSGGFPGGEAAGTPGEDWPFLVRDEDYRAHLDFQAGFSRRVLHSPASSSAGYAHYRVGDDGLVTGPFSLSGGPEHTPPWPPGPPGTVSPGLPGTEPAGGPEIPPFPLADLGDFLAAWESQPPRRPGTGDFPGNLVILLLVLLAALPFARGPGGMEKSRLCL